MKRLSIVADAYAPHERHPQFFSSALSRTFSGALGKLCMLHSLRG